MAAASPAGYSRGMAKLTKAASPDAEHNDRLRKKDYLERLVPLQLALCEVERWVAASGQRLLLLIEGRDTAGKGGMAHALAETLNPRHCRIVALDKPSSRERGQWYFQRYVAHLPAQGEIVIMDRSWYNRAGVEKVMGYCTDEEYRRFLAQAPAFEKLLVDDGILLSKYWLGVDQAKQEERFAERAADPLKRWKLSPIDLAARQRYADYGKAREAMLAATHTPHAPWAVVDFNDQRRGRLTLLRHWIETLPWRHKPQPRLRLPKIGHPPHRERWSVIEPLPDRSAETAAPPPRRR